MTEDIFGYACPIRCPIHVRKTLFSSVLLHVVQSYVQVYVAFISGKEDKCNTCTDWQSVHIKILK